MKMGLVRVALAALMVPVGLPATPAHAATAGLWFEGNATVNPGLPAPPSGASWHADLIAGGVVDVAGTTIVVPAAPCTFDGVSDGPEDALQGVGHGTLTCDASSGMLGADATLRWSFHLSCTLVWQRVDFTWRLVLRCRWVVDWSSNIVAVEDSDATALWKTEPTSLVPFTSFVVAGALVSTS